MARKQVARAPLYGFIERRTCPVCCEGRTIETVFSSPFHEGAVGEMVRGHYRIDPTILNAAPYELVRCGGCTLIYQRFVGDDALLGELYGSWINDHNLPEIDPIYHQQVSRPLESRDGHEILVAAQFLGKRPEQMMVLDFGMGWGLWARIAHQLGCIAYGSELSKDRVEYARKHGIHSISIDEIGQPQFDFINTEQVMEHIRDILPITAKLAASLRPGGILKISVPRGDKAMKIVEALNAGTCEGTLEAMMVVQPLEHVNTFTAQSISLLALRNGLRLVSPGLPTSYAFLKRRGTISRRRAKNAIKELVRPIYRHVDRKNLYLWLRKAVD